MGKRVRISMSPFVAIGLWCAVAGGASGYAAYQNFGELQEARRVAATYIRTQGDLPAETTGGAMSCSDGRCSCYRSDVVRYEHPGAGTTEAHYGVQSDNLTEAQCDSWQEEPEYLPGTKVTIWYDPAWPGSIATQQPVAPPANAEWDNALVYASAALLAIALACFAWLVRSLRRR